MKIKTEIGLMCLQAKECQKITGRSPEVRTEAPKKEPILPTPQSWLSSLQNRATIYFHWARTWLWQPWETNTRLLPHFVPSDQLFPQLAVPSAVFESLLADGQLPPNAQLNTIPAVRIILRPLVYGTHIRNSTTRPHLVDRIATFGP